MITVDTRGESCPKPLIMTKKALKEISHGTPVTVITSSKNACTNISVYLRDLGASVATAEESGEFTLTFNAPPLP